MLSVYIFYSIKEIIIIMRKTIQYKRDYYKLKKEEGEREKI